MWIPASSVFSTSVTCFQSVVEMCSAHVRGLTCRSSLDHSMQVTSAVNLPSLVRLTIVNVAPTQMLTELDDDLAEGDEDEDDDLADVRDEENPLQDLEEDDLAALEQHQRRHGGECATLLLPYISHASHADHYLSETKRCFTEYKLVQHSTRNCLPYDILTTVFTVAMSVIWGCGFLD